jgi:hypothetical protein
LPLYPPDISDTDDTDRIRGLVENVVAVGSFATCCPYVWPLTVVPCGGVVGDGVGEGLGLGLVLGETMACLSTVAVLLVV